MSISVFKTSKTGTEEITSTTAFNIWNFTKSRLESIAALKFYQTFIHDRDFVVFLDVDLKRFNSELKTLEEMSVKYKVKLPPRPPADFNMTQSRGVTDRFIYSRLYADIINELYALGRAMITTTFNDGVRNHFSNFYIDHVKGLDRLFIYGKLKGWQSVEPAFSSMLSGTVDTVSAAGAAHIWDHINERYQQMQLTDWFSQIGHDQEFVAMLTAGHLIMEKQAQHMEKMAKKFRVALPNRPPKKVIVKKDPDSVDDEFLYRTVLTGIQSAFNLHTRAIVETVRDDNLRAHFIQLLEAEMSLYSKYLKYGKTKGWTKTPPLYSME